MCAIVRRIVRPFMSSSDTTLAPSVASTHSYLAPVRRAELNAASPEMLLWHLVMHILEGGQGPWLSNLRIYRPPFTSACSVEPNKGSCKRSSRQSRKVTADVSLPSHCSPATQTPASQPRAMRSHEQLQSAFSKRPSAALTALPRFRTF